jgi:hypothetical protein
MKSFRELTRNEVTFKLTIEEAHWIYRHAARHVIPVLFDGVDETPMPRPEDAFRDLPKVIIASDNENDAARGIRAMSSTVAAYVCASCGALYRKEEEADKCCTCKCGVKIKKERGGWYNSCPTCAARSHLAHSRARVRSLTKDLNLAKVTLRERADEYEKLTGRKPDLSALDSEENEP